MEEVTTIITKQDINQRYKVSFETNTKGYVSASVTVEGGNIAKETVLKEAEELLNKASLIASTQTKINNTFS